VFGLYVYSTAVGFSSLAPTAAKRDQLLNSLASNTGLKALLGGTSRITTRAGFVDWRVIGVASMVGAIWGMLLATKTLRGERRPGTGSRSWPGRQPRAAPLATHWPAWAPGCWPCTLLRRCSPLR
jgi:hypothetical protein